MPTTITRYDWRRGCSVMKPTLTAGEARQLLRDHPAKDGMSKINPSFTKNIQRACRVPRKQRLR